MIIRFIRKDEGNFYGGEMMGEVSTNDMLEVIAILKEDDYKVKNINANELDDICMIVVDNVKKEVRFLKEFHIVEIKFNKIFEDMEQAEKYRDKYDGTLRFFTNELREKRNEKVGNNFGFTSYY